VRRRFRCRCSLLHTPTTRHAVTVSTSACPPRSRTASAPLIAPADGMDTHLGLGVCIWRVHLHPRWPLAFLGVRRKTVRHAIVAQRHASRSASPGAHRAASDPAEAETVPSWCIHLPQRWRHARLRTLEQRDIATCPDRVAPARPRSTRRADVDFTADVIARVTVYACSPSQQNLSTNGIYRRCFACAVRRAGRWERSLGAAERVSG